MKGEEVTDNWLLTAYEKKKSVSVSSSDIETEPKGKRNGTATPQNGPLSIGKDNKLLVQSKKYQKKTYQIVKKTTRSGLIAASERQSLLLNVLLLKQREM